MKRIQAINGYTIYQATARDVEKHNATEGNFYLYFSSDIRDYGLSCSDWDWETDSIETAREFAQGTRYAIAKEIVERETTAATYDQIAAVETALENMDEDERNEVIQGYAEIEPDEGEEEEEEDEPRWFEAIEVNTREMVGFKTARGLYRFILSEFRRAEYWGENAPAWLELSQDNAVVGAALVTWLNQRREKRIKKGDN